MPAGSDAAREYCPGNCGQLYRENARAWLLVPATRGPLGVSGCGCWGSQRPLGVGLPRQPTRTTTHLPLSLGVCLPRIAYVRIASHSRLPLNSYSSGSAVARTHPACARSQPVPVLCRGAAGSAAPGLCRSRHQRLCRLPLSFPVSRLCTNTGPCYVRDFVTWFLFLFHTPYVPSKEVMDHSIKKITKLINRLGNKK